MNNATSVFGNSPNILRSSYDSAKRLVKNYSCPEVVVPVCVGVALGTIAGLRWYMEYRASAQNTSDVLSRASQFITSEADTFASSRIIQAIAAIPLEERENVIQHALEFITPDMNNWNKGDIIEIVAKIPLEQRQDLHLALQLIPSELHLSLRLSIIKDFATIPVGERENVIQHVLQIRMPGMSAWQSLEIITAVSGIPVNKRNGLHHARQFMTPEMSGANIVKIIQAVGAIPIEDRNDLHHALPIIERMSSYNRSQISRSQIIRFVATVPANERQNVLQYAVPFITQRMNVFIIMDLIRAIAAVPANERENVLQHALQFRGEDGRGTAFIQAIAAVPANERQNVLQHARDFMAPPIAAVPANERENVFQHALQFMMEDGWGTAFIQAIAAVPANERENVLQHARDFMAPQVDSNQRLHIIRTIAAIPTIDRQAVMQRALARITPGMEGLFRIFAIERAINPEGINLFDANRVPAAQTLSQRIQAWSAEFEVVFPDRVHQTTDFTPLTSLNPDDARHLNDFLRKLRGISDYENPVTARTRNVIFRVENMLQLACMHPDFRKKMVFLLSEADTECRDRTLFIFNEIEVEQRFYDVFERDGQFTPQAIPDGPFIARAIQTAPYYILKEYARRFAKDKGFHDVIETVVGFHTLLRTELQDVIPLPITTETMSHQDISGVTPQTIPAAKEFMLRHNNPKLLLARSPQWQKRMQDRYPAEAAILDENFGDLGEAAKEYYYGSSPEEKQQLLAKHPKLRSIVLDDPTINSYDRAMDTIQERLGIALAHLGGDFERMMGGALPSYEKMM